MGIFDKLFAPWTSGGVCDVCNEPLRTGAAFKIPVDVIYSSPKYRDWFNRNQMPILRDTYRVPSDITVDIVLANMRSDDPTEYSAVCDKCVELFLCSSNAKVDALIFKLKDPNPAVRESSVREMIALGKPAVEPLIQYLQHPDEWARLMAASALGKMGDTRAIEPLNQVLDDSDEGVRYMAQVALKELTPERRDKKPGIIQELQNLKIKISELPRQYPREGIAFGPGVDQAQEQIRYLQIPIICRNIDEAIRAINTGLDPYNRPITKPQIVDGLKRLVNATRKPSFIGLMMGVLSGDGIQLLENYLNDLEQIANGIS